MATQHQEDLYLLPHTSLYPLFIHSKENLESIVLVSSTFTSKSESDLVLPFLLAKGKYHLLIPDFSCYGENISANNCFPFEKLRLFWLISYVKLPSRERQKLLVYAWELSLLLASLYPDVVNDAVFVSGYEVYPNLDPAGIAPYGLWAINRIERLVPISLIRWAMDGADVQHELRFVTNGSSVTVCREIIRCLSGVDSWPPIPWASRTMVVAAGKNKWFLPSADHPEDGKKLAGKVMNDRTVAMVHPLMRHRWNRQAPEYFSEAIWTWFETGKVKERFHHL